MSGLFFAVLNNIDTQVLKLARLHQKGRVSENDTSVPFNFTEGWFRNSSGTSFKFGQTTSRRACHKKCGNCHIGCSISFGFSKKVLKNRWTGDVPFGTFNLTEGRFRSSS